MASCPLADECPSFSERIEGMGCQHYGDRGGAEWCNHYSQPIEDLKSQPVKIGEEVLIEVEDIHESGAGVGRTGDGFIVMVDGVLPPAHARVEITKVRSNHARAEEIERVDPEDLEDGDATDVEDAENDDADAEGTDTEAAEGEGEDDADAADGDDEYDDDDDAPQLGSRDNFWGN